MKESAFNNRIQKANQLREIDAPVKSWRERGEKEVRRELKVGITTRVGA